MTTPSPILGGFGVSRSSNASDSEEFNLFLEMIAGKNGRAPGWLQMTPGLDLKITVGAGPIRGVQPMGGFLYAVSGNTVYQISTTLIATKLGTISTSTAPVSMIQNGTQLAIFDGYTGWLTTNDLALNGGVPLTGGTITDAGLNYAIGDNITLIGAQGQGDATAIITITATSGRTLAGGTIGAGSSGYVVGQTITLAPTGGTQIQPAILVVSAVSIGVVTAFTIQQAGVFSAQPSAFTQASTSGTGTGFNLTSPTFGGTGAGIATAFSIVQSGLFSSEPTTFTQASTTGSGSGFTLTSPTFGASSNLSQINLPFSGGPVSATYQDGFGVVNDSLSNYWYQSDLFDLSVWEPLNFAQANSQPDNVKALTDLNREIFVFKDYHTEVWINAGVAGFTFQRLEGVFLEYGTSAPFSVVLTGQSICFLAQNGQGGYEIRRIVGYRPDRISTHAVEQEIAKFPTVADAQAYSYNQDGHLFYVIGFPSGDTTFCCDLTDSEAAGQPLWHKRASIEDLITGEIDGNFHRHWGGCYTTWPSGTAQYQPKGIFMEMQQEIATGAALLATPATFTNALFAGWFYIPNKINPGGLWFGNQTDDTAPGTGGVQIGIFNDTSSPAGQQIVVRFFDASGNPIVAATYAWTGWMGWIWIGISVSVDPRLQLYISDGGDAVPQTPTSIIWTSTKPIANTAGQHWHLVPAVTN